MLLAAGNNFMRVWTNFGDRKCSCAAGNYFMQVWTNLCYRECFCEANCWQEFHYEFSRQRFEQKCAEPFCVLMTHHTAKANLVKGSSWPPEAIPYGVPHTRPLVLTPWTRPMPWTRPQIPLGPSPPPYDSIIKNGCVVGMVYLM